MAGRKTRGKGARYFFTAIVLCAIVYLITQLVQKKFQQHYTIILVTALLFTVLTNPILRHTKHPLIIAIMVGVPSLMLLIVWIIMLKS